MKNAITFLFMVFSSLSQAQSTYQFKVHEWGTFTTLCGSDGNQLSGLYIDEEELPRETYNIDWRYVHYIDQGSIQKGYFDSHHFAPLLLKNVTVKMETPVLYFYSDDIPIDSTLEVNVKVNFPNGSISQYFPRRIKGEILPPEVLGYPVQTNVVDFEMPYNGWIEWDARIQNKNHTLPKKAVFIKGNHIWNPPRKTKSNFISCNHSTNPIYDKPEYEKFLFYRGIGNFEPSLKLSFTTHNELQINNEFNSEVPFFMVYEKKKGGEVFIWKIGSLNSGESISVLKHNVISKDKALEIFVNALINAGLYRDEAVAMIETWNESYFETDGLKVFWILPPSYTDEILPIQINPAPEELKRVMVGRSEILTPDFEENLYYNWHAGGLKDSLMNDRFYQAYKERYEQIETTGFRFPDHDPFNNRVNLFPNPTSDRLNYSIPNSYHSNLKIEIRNYNGQLLELHTLEEYVTNGEISLSGLQNGLYIVHITGGNIDQYSRIVKQ